MFRPLRDLERRSVPALILLCLGLLIAIGLVDYLTGVNYGFLLHKPEAASILDYLSDTRWLYIMGLEGLALLFFALLYVPFLIVDFFRSLRS